MVWRKIKLHGTQTPDVAGTIFEGKWKCMMLKLAFEPEHALEVEEIAGHSNACYTLTARLEEDEITGYSNSKKCSECCTVGLTDVKLHGLKPDFSMCRWISGLERCEIAGYSNCIWYWKML